MQEKPFHIGAAFLFYNNDSTNINLSLLKFFKSKSRKKMIKPNIPSAKKTKINNHFTNN